jgi:hypothetical protein
MFYLRLYQGDYFMIEVLKKLLLDSHRLPQTLPGSADGAQRSILLLVGLTTTLRLIVMVPW